MITATAKPAKAKYKVIFVNNGCGWTIYQDAKMVGHITSGPDRNALASAKHWLKFALGGFTVAEIHKALEDKIDPKTGMPNRNSTPYGWAESLGYVCYNILKMNERAALREKLLGKI